MVDQQGSDDERRQLENLDNTVVALPLLQDIKADTKGKKSTASSWN